MSSKAAYKSGRSKKPKAKQKVSLVTLPSPRPNETFTSSGSNEPTRIVQDSPDPFLDPAKQVLLRTQEAKKKRQQAELQIALNKIQDRVDYTLNEYEGPKFKTPSEMDATRAEVNLEVVEDPAYLYELLGDSCQRSKYQQKLTIFIVGYEEKCENREKLLSSLQDFFLETEAGGTQKLLDQIERDEINLDDATSGLENALDTAQNAAQKLLAIKQEMGKLIAIVAAFPDTKKGRKKMEKALLKAQEEVESLAGNLEQVQTELEETKDQTSKLQKQFDVKAQECIKLKAEADKVKLLQVGKEKLTNELKSAESEINALKKELEDTKTMVPSKSEMLVKTTTVAIDRKKIEELESWLSQEKASYQTLVEEKERLVTEHQLEIEALHEDFDADMEEMRMGYEEQLKSLMEDELFVGDEDEGKVNVEESDMFALSKEFSVCVEDSSEGLYDELSKQEVKKSPEEVAHEGEPPLQEHGNVIDQQETKVDTTAENDEPGVVTPPSQDTTNQSDLSQIPDPQPATPSTVPAHPTDAPPDAPIQQMTTPPATSESGSGASTPRRSRRESVAGRRQSVAGKRRESIAGGSRRESIGNTVIEKLKQEFETREKKLRQELDDIKAKSRKTITSLRAQIAMNQNKGNSELEEAKNELNTLKVKLESLGNDNSTLLEQVSSLESENSVLSQELEQTQNELQAQRSLVEQLEKELELSVKDQSSLMKKEDVVDHSAQWSVLSGQSTVGAHSLIKMQEVNGLLTSGASLVSDAGSTSSHLHRGLGQSPLSQSIASLDPAPLGSPLQSGSLISHPVGGAGNLFNISMLAQSKFMHQGSPASQVPLNHDHPVIIEWSKAYDNVLKFKDNMIGVLSECGEFGSVIEDLLSMELHSLDRSQDVQGQITEMRFSLSLMLHQLEQSLADVLGQLTCGDVDAAGNSRVNVMGVSGDGGDELKVTVERLKRRLKEHQTTRHIELEESKETIANLSSKVGTLKAELASLRRSLAQTDVDGGESAIMFTRLDSERNTKTLKSALEKDRISPTTYNKVVTGMQDYLSIAGQRLASLSQHFHQTSIAKHLTQQIQHTYGPDSSQGIRILNGLSNLEQRRQLEFSVGMDRLGLKRIDLAHSLTHTLKHIEKHAGVFLIKPVFSTSIRPRTNALITPIARPLPIKKPYSRPHTGTSHKTPTPHPSMRLVNKLIQSRQQYNRSRGSTDVSGQTSPQQFRHLHTSHTTPLPPHTLTHGEDDWYVETSRPASSGCGLMNPLASHVGPTLPRMMEMDIRKQRHHEALLGHILPCLHQAQPTHTVHRIPSPDKLMPEKTKSEEVIPKSRSKVIPSQSSGLIAPLTMRVEFDFPSGHAPLPPITPSRTALVIPQ